MGVIEGGVSGHLAEVDASFDALHVTVRPINVGSGGSYRCAMASGLINANPLAADSTLFSFRNTDATYRSNIRLVTAEMFCTAGPTTAQEMGLDLIVARSFSASDSGGTAATFSSTNNNKKRGSHNAARVGDFRIASTAGLTAGTRTLDSNPIAETAHWELLNAAAVQHNVSRLTFDAREPGLYPLNLGQNEGFIIRNTISHPTAMTVRLVVTVEWDEITSTDWAG